MFELHRVVSCCNYKCVSHKWCYSDGEFEYTSKEQLINFCVEHMANENWPAEQVRAHMEAVVPQLNHWK